MKKWIRSSDQTPSGFRCGINYHRLYIFHDQSDIALTDKQVLILTNETATLKYLCETALNQSIKGDEEQTELIEAENYLKQLKMDYEQLQNEIVDDTQLDLTTHFQ